MKEVGLSSGLALTNTNTNNKRLGCNTIEVSVREPSVERKLDIHNRGKPHETTSLRARCVKYDRGIVVLSVLDDLVSWGQDGLVMKLIMRLCGLECNCGMALAVNRC